MGGGNRAMNGGDQFRAAEVSGCSSLQPPAAVDHSMQGNIADGIPNITADDITRYFELADAMLAEHKRTDPDRGYVEPLLL